MNPIRHQLEREALGISDVKAVVDAWTNTFVPYCSPIAGEPDLANQAPITGFRAILTGFLLPKAGILDGVKAIFQGNGGNNGLSSINVRVTVATIQRNPARTAGLNVGEILYTGLTSVINNASGDITLATGLNLNVPSQFIVLVKAADTAGTINIQNMLSAGPLPGIRAALLGSVLFSAPVYEHMAIDNLDPPAIPVAGSGIQTANAKPSATYIMWKGE